MVLEEIGAHACATVTSSQDVLVMIAKEQSDVMCNEHPCIYIQGFAKLL